MSAIRTVNMIWERRIRGAYPLAACALDDAGTLAVSVPRPLEPRTHDLTRLALDGGSELRVPFSVETLLKLELSATSDDFLGITSDDLYLFHGGSKGRFLGDQRILIIDAAMSRDGRTVAAAFSDMAGVSFAVAYGGIAGNVIWLREADTPVTAIAISCDGSRVLFGGESGTLWLIDSTRRDLWEFGLEAPVSALALSLNGLAAACASTGGAVGLISSDGSRRWEAHLPGEVSAVALSAEGELCAAVCRQGDAGTGRIFCLTDHGHVGWDYDAERRLTGICLSPGGQYLATSGRDGTITLYEVIPSDGAGAHPVTALDLREQAAVQAESGDVGGALDAIHAALETEPDITVCERLCAQAAEIIATALGRARLLCAENDPAGAMATLGAVLARDPVNVPVAQALGEARRLRAAQLATEAETALAAGDTKAADAALREAVAVAPLEAMEARRSLAALRQRSAADADTEAERLLAAGELAAGVAALERAQGIAHTPERARKLDVAHTAMEFAAGMDAYNEKRYSEAIFQFKKVLARDPGHAEAGRHLNFAQKFAQDAANESLTDRFSRLE